MEDRAFLGDSLTRYREAFFVTIHPNPVKELINFIFSPALCNNVLIAIYNHKGELVKRKVHPKKSFYASIDLADQPNGEYDISIRSGKMNIRKKLVFKRQPALRFPNCLLRQ